MYNPDKECKAMIAALKKICEQKNMTPYAVAKEAGISSSTVSYIMSGRTKPQIYTILMMCNVLGVTISQLFEEKDAGMSAKGAETVCQDGAAGKEESESLIRGITVEKEGSESLYRGITAGKEESESLCQNITCEEKELLKICRGLSEKKRELLKIYMNTLQQI